MRSLRVAPCELRVGTCGLERRLGRGELVADARRLRAELIRVGAGVRELFGQLVGLGDGVVTRRDRGVQPRLEVGATLGRALRGARRGRELRDEIRDARLRGGPLGIERFGPLGQLAARRLERDPGQVSFLRRVGGDALGLLPHVDGRRELGLGGVGACGLHVEVAEQPGHVLACRFDLHPESGELAVAGRDRTQLARDAVALDARVTPRGFDLREAGEIFLGASARGLGRDLEVALRDALLLLGSHLLGAGLLL